MQTTQRPIKNNDSDHIMLNRRRVSERRIHSFKLSRETIKYIKHEPYTLWWSVTFDVQYKREGIDI